MGLLNVVTGKWAPLSSRLWVQGGLDYEYDPSAKCSRWEQFLWEILPGDQVAQDCIEEEIGYGMTLDTRFEKAFCWYSQETKVWEGNARTCLEQVGWQDGFHFVEFSYVGARRELTGGIGWKEAGDLSGCEVEAGEVVGAEL